MENNHNNKYSAEETYLAKRFSTTPVQIDRPVYEIEELNKQTHYEHPHISLAKKCDKFFKSIRPLDCILSTIPLLKWLPDYKWRKSFPGDLASGLTVCVMHIPQGMAYALLGGVPPIVGLYMAFFPVLVYFVFGSSRHVSMGTFAIVCLMTGKIVHDYATVEILQDGSTKPILEGANPSNHEWTTIQVAVTVTFTVACIQLVMYMLRLGIVATLLSETLVNGFTCASAFHVVSSQLKDLFGLAVTKRRGYFSFLLTFYDSFRAITTANTAAVCVSAGMIAILVFNNYVFKPWMAKKSRFQFPIELFVISVGTALSYFLNLNGKYNVTIVGHVPTGLPSVTIPLFELIPDIFVDALLVTIVSYSITVSMGLIFAKKLMYEIDPNQELLALGLSNTAGAFFSCLPVTASLSRSMIQQAVGGVTQLASIVSCTILLFILLWIGPVFEALPKCVLASIIVVALKGMILQCFDFKKYLKLSKWDASVWIVTFTTTLLVDISVGLAAGVAASLTTLFLQGYMPYVCLLGVVPNTDLYLDVKRYKGVHEIAGIKIFHYSGGLNFASRTNFMEHLNKKMGFHLHQTISKRNELMQQQQDLDNNYSTSATATEAALQNDESTSAQSGLMTKCIILDFACLTFIDPTGVDFLRQLQVDYAILDIDLYIAACLGPVYETIKACLLVEGKENKIPIFPTVHDAVVFAQDKMLIETTTNHYNDNQLTISNKDSI